MTCVSTKSSAQESISVKDAQADLDSMIALIASVHYNAFHSNDEESVQSFKDSLAFTWSGDSVSIREFTRRGMQIAALMSKGHTALDWQNSALYPSLAKHQFVPFCLSREGDNYVVTRSLDPNLVVGDSITHLNGIPIEDLHQEVMSYFGGLEPFRNSVTSRFFPLFLFFRPDLKSPYSISSGSKNTTIDLEALSFESMWQFVVEETFSVPYEFQIVEQEIGLLSYNACEDYDRFSVFLDSTFRVIKNKGVDRLIIDLRSNSGGNSSLNDLLLSYLTQEDYRQSSGRIWKVSQEVRQKIERDSLWYDVFDIDHINTYLTTSEPFLDRRDSSLRRPISNDLFFEGKHCFLIGPYTFSSANYLADAVKTFELSTLIGAATGEFTNDFGEQVEFQLPRSGSYVFIPTTYDIGANGDESLLEPVYPHVSVKGDALEFAIIRFLYR